MKHADRVKLLFGPYRTPRFRIGQRVRCEVRGAVVVVGLSDAPVPWPLCRCGKWRVPVVYRGLARAVRRESAAGICFWWRASEGSVWRWRKALGISRVDPEGSRRLIQAGPVSWPRPGRAQDGCA